MNVVISSVTTAGIIKEYITNKLIGMVKNSWLSQKDASTKRKKEHKTGGTKIKLLEPNILNALSINELNSM